jgi:protein-S-isoprenylcysteine O-methyltransferase Ste14
MMEDHFRNLMLTIAAPFLAFLHLNFFRMRRDRAVFSHRNEPLLLQVAVRLSVLSCMVGMVLYMIDPQRMHWASLPLPAAVRWAGAPLLLAAELSFIWSMQSLDRNFSLSLAIFDDHQLVQHGPYRWSRHPMYASVALILVALFLVTANWFIAGALGVAAVLVVAIRVPLEEATLHARFGEHYARYAARTGRYWPRLRRDPNAAHVAEPQ